MRCTPACSARAVRRERPFRCPPCRARACESKSTRSRMPTGSRVDIDEVFSKGGRTLIDFLDYSVRSIQMDPVFIFLVREYHTGPTVAKAVALYDLFCAPDSQGRISCLNSLPPKDMR